VGSGRAQANHIHQVFKRRSAGVRAVGPTGVEPETKGGFLSVRAACPWAALQAHDKHLTSDEMGICAGPQKSGVGGVSARGAQVFRSQDIGRGAALFKSGSGVSDRGNGRTHAA